MDRGAALEIHEVEAGLAFEQSAEHLDVATLGRHHERGKTGFIRGFNRSAGIDQFADDFPLLFQRGCDRRVLSPDDGRAQIGLSVETIIDPVRSPRGHYRQLRFYSNGWAGDECRLRRQWCGNSRDWRAGRLRFRRVRQAHRVNDEGPEGEAAENVSNRGKAHLTNFWGQCYTPRQVVRARSQPAGLAG